jgi:hypothetical protein
MTIFFNPKSLCNGQIAMSPMAVVQLGLAINFFPFVVSELISGTTSGIPSLYRKAEELSMTTAPSAPSQIASACFRLKSPSTARNTTSHSLADDSLNSSTVTLPNLVSTTLPALRSEPKMRRFPTGKDRFSRTPTISFPTAPVAPTMPTLKDPADILVIVVARFDGGREGEDARGERMSLRVADAKDETDEAGTKPYVEEERELATIATIATAAELIFIIFNSIVFV